MNPQNQRFQENDTAETIKPVQISKQEEPQLQSLLRALRLFQV